jgi:heterodisulfide reductase subunit A
MDSPLHLRISVCDTAVQKNFSKYHSKNPVSVFTAKGIKVSIMPPRIGVYICECGPNIKDAVDVEALLSVAKDQTDVVHTQSFGFLCSPEGQLFLKEEVRANDLSRVVIAGCSPKEHEQTFREVLKNAGLNPFLLQMANIREQCTWVIQDENAATEKAGDLIRAAIRRVRLHEPLELKTIDCCADVLIVGAGVAGISAALAAAGKNRRVYLIDKEPCIGGRVARYEDLYPDMVCASCLIEDQLDAVLHHDRIEVMTMTEIFAVKGYFGNFTVNVRQKARYVDEAACIGCEACFEACPVKVPDPLMGEPTFRKAIYLPYFGALPNVAVIDRKNCLRLQGKSCGACRDACPFEAIQYEAADDIRELKVGALAVATGFDPFDPRKDDRYGYGRVENVVTSLEFEQLVNSAGPTQGKIRLKNGRPPRHIAFVHCVGSRTEQFNDYCSGVCCLYTLKHAHQARLQLPEAEIYQFHADLCLSGKGSQRFYQKVLTEDRVRFHRMLQPGSIEIKAASEKIAVTCADGAGELTHTHVDMVVLATALESASETKQMAKMLDVKLEENGFFVEADARMDPVATTMEGIFMAGCVQGPKDISSSVAQGYAVAGKILGKLRPQEQLELEPMACEIDPEICSGCLTCKTICAFKAIEAGDQGSGVSINPALCKACGACAAACPSGAVAAKHFSTPAIVSELKGLMGEP